MKLVQKSLVVNYDALEATKARIEATGGRKVTMVHCEIVGKTGRVFYTAPAK